MTNQDERPKVGMPPAGHCQSILFTTGTKIPPPMRSNWTSKKIRRVGPIHNWHNYRLLVHLSCFAAAEITGVPA